MLIHIKSPGICTMCTKKIRQSHSEFHPQDAMTWKHKGDFTANNVQSDTDIIW